MCGILTGNSVLPQLHSNNDTIWFLPTTGGELFLHHTRSKVIRIGNTSRCFQLSTDRKPHSVTQHLAWALFSTNIGLFKCTAFLHHVHTKSSAWLHDRQNKIIHQKPTRSVIS